MLRQRANLVEKGTSLSPLVEDMFETMYQANGVGLAAPQVGKSLRLFIVDTLHLIDSAEEFKGQSEQPIKQVFVNPEILELSGEPWAMEEGCLSIPDIRESVVRPEKVHIRYYDADWQLYETVYTGFTARVILHEYDHIEGKLFIDYLSPLKRRLLRRKLERIARGEVQADYPMRFALR